ncbi:MAG: hypothetical protein DWQ47_16860 [Acidobacteria bacterium]|nr:MAG: hypothetical protein DWQ32_04260 [Acidobacteriota bacterium]REK02286.1 MAG: hypothetical protein DWQ38_07890 [Acidobacteriota bacterium]REK13911.1 MAG: hypothetical protein DWQ43_09950 [Acidobacteriota bacterium]REK41905.1 MAG: hypothetical protein DWQ47_16860 [Acidobacteriota bacterium]
MDSFISGQRGNPGISKILVAGILVGALVIAGLIWFVFSLPTPKEQKAELLVGAIVEGSPEFEEYTKNIIITNDVRRMQEARTGLGDVVMKLSARIKNRGKKTLSGLEVSVGMVDTENELIKDKRVLFVPKHHPELGPGEEIDVSVSIAGFRRGDDRANARWKVTAIKFADD